MRLLQLIPALVLSSATAVSAGRRSLRHVGLQDRPLPRLDSTSFYSYIHENAKRADSKPQFLNSNTSSGLRSRTPFARPELTDWSPRLRRGRDGHPRCELRRGRVLLGLSSHLVRSQGREQAVLVVLPFDQSGRFQGDPDMAQWRCKWGERRQSRSSRRESAVTYLFFFFLSSPGAGRGGAGGGGAGRGGGGGGPGGRGRAPGRGAGAPAAAGGN